jgi:hypothetical protein
MANYINKEIICEAYIHLDSIDGHDLDSSDLEIKLKKFFQSRVTFFLGETVKTQVEIYDGSIKAKLTAYAGIATLIGSAVLKYPEFKDSLKSIHADSLMLAEATNMEAIFLTKTPRCDRINSEVRTGIIGRAAKLVTNIETLKEKSLILKAPDSKKHIKNIDEISEKLLQLEEESKKILDKVKNNEDKLCLTQGFYESFNQLPDSLPAEKDLKNNPIKRASLKSVLADGQAELAFKNYQSVLKILKENLKKTAIDLKPKNT